MTAKQEPKKPTLEEALESRTPPQSRQTLKGMLESLSPEEMQKAAGVPEEATPEKIMDAEKALAELNPDQYPLPDQTHDEIVEQALGEANVENQMLEPPQEEMSQRELQERITVRIKQIEPELIAKAKEIMEQSQPNISLGATIPTQLGIAISSQPEMVTQEVPASNIDPQPAIKNSTPELQGPTLIINTDVAMECNPGPAAVACIVRDGSGEIIDTTSRKVGYRTNNAGEYLGVIEALRYALQKKASAVIIRSDSELIVKQINGEYQTKEDNLRVLLQKVKSLMVSIKAIPGIVEILYVPREKNKEADKLAGEVVRPKASSREPGGHYTSGDVKLMLKAGGDVEPGLRKLLEYVHGNEYSSAWVQLHITSISSYPNVMPSPTLWDVPNDVDIAKLVYTVAVSPGYVETTWPYLRLLLGSSRDNVEWAVSVYTTLCLFETVKLLPLVDKNKDENDS